jgi:hypothetical protein
MIAKTERFGMRLDRSTLERIDAWRSRQSDLPSRAEAIRRLVDEGLRTTTHDRFEPTNAEKLSLWMLAEILKGQKGAKEADTAKFLQEVIHGGHFWAVLG